VSIGLACHFSDAEHGNWSEADFWFLLQVSSFQCCELVVTGLTLPKEASKWNWVPIGAGVWCTLAGPAIYTSTPRFCGVLLNALAGFIQAYVVLWEAIAERIK